MAFRSSGPTTLALPAFRGVTRQIILVCLVCFFAFWLIASFVPHAGAWLGEFLALTPASVFRGQVWQLLTYAFFPLPLMSELFALLSLWFIGAGLEDQLGSRWLREYFFAAVIGGGLLASLLAYVSNGRLFALSPGQATAGLYPVIMALLLAFARYNAEQEILLFFVLRLKAKYLAAIYLLLYLASAMIGGDRFGALTALCASLAGWLYLRSAPRRGLGPSMSESWYGMRNAWYRWKRRRAAKQFQVYMRDQGRDVRIDANGRFVDDDRGKPRDPNDRSWMN